MRASGLVVLVVLLAVPVRAQHFDDDGAAEIADRIDEAREEAGVAPLEPHPGLESAARTHSEAIAKRGELVHVTDETGDPAARAAAAGVKAGDLVQHIAHGEDALAAHASLTRSEPHRQRLLDPELTHLGVGVVVNEAGAWVTELLAHADAPEAPEHEPPPAAPPPEWRSPETPTHEAAMADSTEAEAGATEEGDRIAVRGGSGSTVVRVERRRGGGRLLGYWVLSRGRWWYYPWPDDAQPGQVLEPHPTATGPPPGEDPAPQVAPPPRPRIRVLVLPRRPPPPFGWSPRRHDWRWRYHRR
ncbi:MAG: CAP domain-containing protein [Myxococcota bacterium]